MVPYFRGRLLLVFFTGDVEYQFLRQQKIVIIAFGPYINYEMQSRGFSDTPTLCHTKIHILLGLYTMCRRSVNPLPLAE